MALRIQVANVARRFPQVLASLSEGKITLSVAGRLAPYLREENWARLLSDAAGMTKREVEEYLVSLNPRPLFEPSIRRLPSGGERTGEAQRGEERGTSPDEREGREERGAQALPSGEATPRPRPPSLDLIEPARAEVYNFRFAAGRGFKEKLVRLAEVLGVEDPERNIAAGCAR